VSDTGTSYIVRPAQEHDVPRILDIYNWAVANTTATADCDPQTIGQRAEWYRNHVSCGYPVLVAEDTGGKVVGFASLSSFNSKVAYSRTAENSLYVDPYFHAMGIGRALLGKLIDASRESGMHTIVALITADNDVSIRLHKSFGFKEVGRISEAMFKFHKPLDVAYLQLML
jgi:phosphinothricin acetyltransferase